MGDADATQERRDVVADVDEIIEHVINANMLNMPYYVYSELFDAVDGLGAEIENLQSENAKLRDELDLCLKCEECEAMLDCDECLRADASQKERKRVDYENAKLREQLESIVGRSFRTADKMACLEAENAKLRELVRTFYHCTTSGECDECPINGGGQVHLMPDTICDTIHARMRELGVEV